ncbi:hypothetical protein QJQ45_021284 [Haematococcus lacustris]|nr:hypothetical protein QJQ45_021284 [Haematococcus lacustris]
MGRRTKRSKNASAKMAAQVAAGIAPWTRMAGFIANRLKGPPHTPTPHGQTDHWCFSAVQLGSRQRRRDGQKAPMGRRTKRSKNASAKMAAQVAAGIAPWTRMAGFIANRLKSSLALDSAGEMGRRLVAAANADFKVLEAELQASQTQHGADAAASQQRLCAQAGAGAIGFDSKGDNLGIIMQFALPMRFPAPATPPSPTPANPPSPTITSQPTPARPARVIRRPSRFATDSPLLIPPPPNTPCLPSSLSQGSASQVRLLVRVFGGYYTMRMKFLDELPYLTAALGDPSTAARQWAARMHLRYLEREQLLGHLEGEDASKYDPLELHKMTADLEVTRDTGMLTPAMEQLLSRYYRATHMTNAVPETMLKQLNNDSVLRMNAEGMSGRAKLAMEDTTAFCQRDLVGPD